jgi:hypothetical protein
MTSLTPRRPTASKLAQQLGPEGFFLRGPDIYPSPSRRPSLFTLTAMITATEMIRPL